MTTALRELVLKYTIPPHQIEYLRAVQRVYKQDYGGRAPVDRPCVDLMLTPSWTVENVQYIKDLRHELDDLCEGYYQVTLIVYVKVYLSPEVANESPAIQEDIGSTQQHVRACAG